jgi:hypothetical protein
LVTLAKNAINVIMDISVVMVIVLDAPTMVI